MRQNVKGTPRPYKAQLIGWLGKGGTAGLIYSLLYSIVLIIIFMMFHPGYADFMVIITGGWVINKIVFLIWRKKKPEKPERALIKLWIFGSLIYWFAVYTGRLGLFGILLFIFVIAAYKIFMSRSHFVEGLRSVEAGIFGKSLDRKNWKKGELRKTKLKFVWRKK